MSKHIKDLKDLSILRVYACYRHSGPTDLKKTRDVFSVARAMARETRSDARVASEGPRPTMKGDFCRRCPSRRDDRKKEEIETRRSLLQGKRNRSRCHETIFDNNEL